MLLRPDSVLYGLVVLAPGTKPDFNIAPMFCGSAQGMEQTHRCVSSCDVLGMGAKRRMRTERVLWAAMRAAGHRLPAVLGGGKEVWLYCLSWTHLT